MIGRGGRVLITGQRALCTSTQQNREWAFSKLVDMYRENGVTFMAVSNRQKTSGFACGTTVAQAFEDRIALALALFDDGIQTLVSGLPRGGARDEVVRAKKTACVVPIELTEVGHIFRR